MRKFVAHTVACTSLFLLGFTVFAGAQQQKIGYVNTDQILSQMPSYEGAQQQLQQIGTEWKEQLKVMDEEIQKLKKGFQSQKVLYTDEQKEKKRQRIQKKMNRRQEFMKQKFGAKGEYFQKQKELLEPIQQRIFKAIDAVAKQQNFDFIFDRAQNSGLLYGKGEFNLNDRVLQQLDITLKESRN